MMLHGTSPVPDRRSKNMRSAACSLTLRAQKSGPIKPIAGSIQYPSPKLRYRLYCTISEENILRTALYPRIVATVAGQSTILRPAAGTGGVHAKFAIVIHRRLLLAGPVG